MFLELIKAVPQIIALLKALSGFIKGQQIKKMEKENEDAFKKADETKDQRPVEELLNPNGSGEPSGHDGAIIVDELPGLPNRMQVSDKKRS